MLEKDRHWNRCDHCGRFIKYDDLGNGATCEMVTPDSAFNCETYEMTCVRCNAADGYRPLPGQMQFPFMDAPTTAGGGA